VVTGIEPTTYGLLYQRRSRSYKQAPKGCIEHDEFQAGGIFSFKGHYFFSRNENKTRTSVSSNSSEKRRLSSKSSTNELIINKSGEYFKILFNNKN